MSDEKIQKYSGWKVRSVWDDLREEWWLSLVDVVGVLTEQSDTHTARKYWNKLKQRLKEEGSQLVTNCHQLKMTSADGIARKAVEERTGRRVITSDNAERLNPMKDLIEGLVEGDLGEENE